MNLQEIRNDLRNIRYYYVRKENFDEFKDEIGENKITEVAKRYNRAVVSAPPKLYDLYISLYVKGNTQEELADQLDFTTEYVQMLNKKLMIFFQKAFNELKE